MSTTKQMHVYIPMPKNCIPPSPITVTRQMRRRAFKKETRTYTGRVLLPGTQEYIEIMQAMRIPSIGGIPSIGHGGRADPQGFNSGSATPPVGPSVAPTAFWRLDGGSGTQETDTVGGIILAVSAGGTVGSTAGQIGNCRTFDGSTDYLGTSDATMSPGSSPFEFGFWVYYTTLFGHGVNSPIAKAFANFPPNNIEYWTQLVGGNAFAFDCSANGSGSTQVTQSTVTATTWLFISMGWDGTNIFVTINNGTLATAAFAGPLHTGSAAFTLGYNHFNVDDFWVGRLDAIAYFKGAVLSTADRTALYNGGNGTEYYSGQWN